MYGPTFGNAESRLAALLPQISRCVSAAVRKIRTCLLYSINEGNSLWNYLRFELLRLHFKMLEILK
jgi:hypothetical protein